MMATDPVVEERKRMVEAVIDAAARWGFDQARASGGAPFVPPTVEWAPDDRPSIATLTVPVKRHWSQVLWDAWLSFLLLGCAVGFVALLVWAVVQAVA